MRSQLELGDSQIYELKRLYKESRVAEARNADVVQQLRVELARYEGCMQCSSAARRTDSIIVGGMTANTVSLQQQNTELRDRVTQLESQLRFLSHFNTCII